LDIEKFPFVGVDTETTGLNSSQDEIIEVVAVEFNLNGETGEIFNEMCVPMSGYISPKASAVNGITMEMLTNKPNYLKDGVREALAKFFGDRTIVGHNLIGFDLKFIKIKPKYCEDTLQICRKQYRSGNKLKLACKRFGIAWNDEDAHRAEYDTMKTIELFCCIKKSETQERQAQETLPLFGDLEPAKPEDLKKLGVIPSDDDKKLMATQAYSYSRINLYRQCPFKWYMQYIKKIPQPQQSYFETGKICHKIAEWAGNWCYRELFANKFQAYFALKNLIINKEAAKDIAANLNKNEEDVTVKDFGFYLHDDPGKIKNFFEGINGKSSIIYQMDHTIADDSYERPSMPDWETYDRIIQKAIEHYKCDDPAIIQDIEKIMARFYDLKDFSLTPGDITITEKRLAFDKNWKTIGNFFSNKAFFRGIIDVIDYFGEYIIITDYKTSRAMLKQEQLKNDRQMQVYLLLVYMFLPKESYKKIIIRIEYIRYGKMIEDEITDIKAIADKALRWINDSVQAIESEMLKTDGSAFPPIRNEYCHTCHIGEDAKCPLFDKQRINDIGNPFTFRILDTEDCKNAWKRIEANKTENSRLQKLCKSFIDKCSDAVTIDEKAVLDFYVKEDRSFSAEKVMTRLLEKGVDIQYLVKFLNITKTSFEALCKSKDIEMTEEELDEVSSKKTKTTFDAFTSKESQSKGFINT